MPVEFITTDQTTAYTIDQGDVVFLLPDVPMTATSSAFTLASGVTDFEL